MKKSKSSVPRFWARYPPLEPPDPDARNEGFDGGAGLFEELPGAWRVAIAVGKTKDGESLPANLFSTNQPRVPNLKRKVRAIPHFCVSSSIINDGCKLTGHIGKLRRRTMVEESSNEEVRERREAWKDDCGDGGDPWLSRGGAYHTGHTPIQTQFYFDDRDCCSFEISSNLAQIVNEVNLLS